MGGLVSDLALAFMLADVADTVTLKLWSPHGVASKTKADGTPVTTADGEAEDAILRAVGAVHPDDGFLGEEIGSRQSRNERRWIVDGIDGTSGYVAGLTTWGTLIALEQRGEIILGVVSSPAQDKRWWHDVTAERSLAHANQTRTGIQSECHPISALRPIESLLCPSSMVSLAKIRLPSKMHFLDVLH